VERELGSIPNPVPSDVGVVQISGSPRRVAILFPPRARIAIPIPAFLVVPYDAIAGVLDGSKRELAL
jgi:hypothetical protein